MTADQLRSLIRDRLTALGCSVNRAATLADLPESWVRSYLGGADSGAGPVLALAAAVGLDVAAKPRKGFALAPARGPGRPAKPV